MKDDYEYDVFLSYDSADPAACDIAERLRRDNVRVWFAPSSMKGGDHYPTRIREALSKSRRIACLMTARAYERAWVEFEVDYVLSRDPTNKAGRLVPVRVDTTPVPSALSQLHFIDWYSDPARAYNELLERCRNPQTAPSGAVTHVNAPATFADILALSNRAALSLFAEHVRGISTTGEADFPRERHAIAGRYWGDEEYEAQRRYVLLRLAETPEFVHQKACQLLHDGFTSGKKTHIWIIGEAGTGKTTLMYKMYFDVIQALDRANTSGEPAPYPIPMLFQPQKMDEQIIDRLRTTAHETDFIATIFDIWLMRRQFIASETDRSKLRTDFFDALRRGTVVLFIDSYDELGRMDIQLDMFRHVFKIAKHYLCATRPEMYAETPEQQQLPLRISSTWDIPTIGSHLEHVFPDTLEIAHALTGYIAKNNTLKWLRNPRYLELLSKILTTRIRLNNTATADVFDVIERGQYKLLDHLYRVTIQRLDSIGPNLRFRLTGEAFQREVRQRLQHVARSQVETGTLAVPFSSVDEIWLLLAANASEIVARRRDPAPTDDHFRLVSYNWVDYFLVDLVLHDLLSPSSAPLSLPHLWTQTLLTYVAEAAWDHPDGTSLPDLIRGKLSFLRVTPISVTRRNADVNLVQLLVRLATSKNALSALGDAANHSPTCFDDEDFSQLNLDSIDFHKLLFRRCRFSSTRLTKANLEQTQFESCDFSNADLRDANADHSRFIDCTFTLEETPTAVVGMSMQGATVIANGNNEFETFKRFGVIPLKSRYQSPFGKLFFNQQRPMLGPGLERAENVYLTAIRAAVEASPGDQRYLVDLMAGGGNERLIDLLQRDSSLRVLAIDRDGHHMDDIVERIGVRFAMVEREIEGRMDIGAVLGATFDIHKANLIIAKKALHELPRYAQAELIASAADALRADGRLILFTDSPYEIDGRGLERLAALRNALVSYHDRDLAPLQDELLSLSFDFTSRSDLAVFSNLWVHLKDWANGYDRELRNRYFSGAHEVESWAEEAGLLQLGHTYADHYQLIARRFNEVGFNQACLRLEESQGIIHDRDVGFYRDKLEGTERFRLFCEIVEHHLWDAAHERPTALGAALNAKKEPLRFHDFNPALRVDRLGLSYDAGIGFDFTIHVHVFERKRT